jgi:hypothetical protein
MLLLRHTFDLVPGALDGSCWKRTARRGRAVLGWPRRPSVARSASGLGRRNCSRSSSRCVVPGDHAPYGLALGSIGAVPELAAHLPVGSHLASEHRLASAPVLTPSGPPGAPLGGWGATPHLGTTGASACPASSECIGSGRKMLEFSRRS